MREYFIQEVDTFDLVAALGPDFSCDAWAGWGDDPMTDPAELITDKIEDYFGDVSSEYLIDAMEMGGQEDPIVVGVNGWNEYGKTNDWILGNGNHRLAIAIGLMIPTILVVFTEDKNDYMVSRISEAWERTHY